jgi:hypothetical protein
MSFQDKTIRCADCGTDFSFTAEDQEFFQSKGYINEPKRCPSCRQARKTERNGSRGDRYDLPRQMFPAVCAPTVAKRRKYLLPLPTAGQSIVAIATEKSDRVDNSGLIPGHTWAGDTWPVYVSGI